MDRPKDPVERIVCDAQRQRVREEYKRRYAEESLVTSAQAMIEDAMENAGVDEKEMARRMACPRAKVRDMLGLSGRGLSVRRLALALYVLGASAPMLSQKEPNG